MSEVTQSSGIVMVRACGELDQSASRRLVADVRSRLTEKTSLVVVSLAETTGVHWNALCLLGHVAKTWRTAMRNVVVHEARPSLRAMLTSIDGLDALPLN
jgi:ABC-type transporter Mla MlaB component